MSHQILTSAGGVFVVWGRPRLEDLDAVIEAVARASARARAPIVYINRIPAEAEAPGPEFRKALDQRLPASLKHISSYHVVLEGIGFTAALKRGVLAAVFLASGKRGVFHVHASSSEVIGAVDPSRRADIVALLRQAEAHGLLSAPPPVSVPPPRWQGGRAV